MNSQNDELLKQTRKALDDSADALDAQTLSRLNKARQKALHSHRERKFQLFKLPFAGVTAGVVTSISIATVSVWLWTMQLQQLSPQQLSPQQLSQVQLAYDDEDINMLISDTELELLDELEFMSWLVLEQASNVEQNQEQNNAG